MQSIQGNLVNLDFTTKPDKDTFLLFVFDRDFVTEKEFTDHDFYDFSEMYQRNLYDWVKSELE